MIETLIEEYVTEGAKVPAWIDAHLTALNRTLYNSGDGWWEMDGSADVKSRGAVTTASFAIKHHDHGRVPLTISGKSGELVTLQVKLTQVPFKVKIGKTSEYKRVVGSMIKKLDRHLRMPEWLRGESVDSISESWDPEKAEATALRLLKRAGIKVLEVEENEVDKYGNVNLYIRVNRKITMDEVGNIFRGTGTRSYGMLDKSFWGKNVITVSY